MGDFDLSQDRVHVADAEMVSQWRSVLRLVSGDSVILTDGSGTEAEAGLESLDKKEAFLSVTSRTAVIRGPKREITLYAALLRRENFELVVQKATEIGATRIVPLLTTRTVKTGHNALRLSKIITEACEQSGRTTRPILSEPLSFEEAVAECAPAQTILFHVSDTDLQRGISGQEINLLIGPEGGFTEEEVQLAQERGIPVRSLGSLTLRAETAAIAVTFLASLG